MLKYFIKLLFIVILLSSCNQQPTPTPIGWTAIKTKTSPPPIMYGAIAYNRSTNTAVLFGGTSDYDWLDETWIWNGSIWMQKNITRHPPTREKFAMAYDDAHNKVVLFGGVGQNQILFDDTWEWNGVSWQLMEPAHKPPARCCHAMTYESERKKVLLYGGYDSNKDILLNDTWEWDGQDWTEVANDSPIASGHNIIEHTSINEIIVLYSGRRGTWAWDGKEWYDLNILDPPGRSDGRIAYDEKNGRTIFFGGSHKGEQLMEDTWVFDGKNWFELNLPIHPNARRGHVMFYDRKRERIILFGGGSDEERFNDTWELNLPDDLTHFIKSTKENEE